MGRHPPMSFPRKRESTPIEWTPAFAGATTWGALCHTAIPLRIPYRDRRVSLGGKLVGVLGDGELFVRRDDENLHGTVHGTDLGLSGDRRLVGFEVELNADLAHAPADLLAQAHRVFPDATGEHNGIERLKHSGVGADVLPDPVAEDIDRQGRTLG